MFQGGKLLEERDCRMQGVEGKKIRVEKGTSNAPEMYLLPRCHLWLLTFLVLIEQVL